VTSRRDRMPPLAQDNMSAAQREAAQELSSGRRGELSGPFVAALRSPEFMRRLQRLGEYLRYDSALEPRLREMVILLTAREWTQEYEWYVHYPIALRAGLKREIIEAIADGRRPSRMTDEEELIFDFVLELQTHRSVSDATYRHAVESLGEQAVIDLVGTTGYYATLAMIMNVARTPLPEGNVSVLPSLPR
jgi:4-carboxymuconolactone decarboxylase